jgi:hypothetical protein
MCLLSTENIESIKVIVQIVGLVLGSSGLLMFFFTIMRNNRTRKLKKERSILEPIISLQIKDFYDVTVDHEKTNGSRTRVTYKLFYSKLQYVLHSIRINEIKNQNIKEQLNAVLKEEPQSLIISDPPPVTYYAFSSKLEKLILDTRIYLSEIL